MLETGLNQCAIAFELLFTYFTVLQQHYWGVEKIRVNTYYDKEITQRKVCIWE